MRVLEAAAFLPADACCCDTGSADVLVRSGSERGRSRSHVECLFSSVTHQGVTGQSLMSWDADGNRVSFTSSTNPGNPHTFVYDTTAGIPAVIEEVLPSESSVYYVREPNGALIARIAGSDVKYCHFDALGSTRLLTDSDGEVTDTYSYNAWGKLTTHTGSTLQPYMFVGQLGYYSHYQDDNLFDDPNDPDSGWQLLQLGVRFYDPTLGRFTQRDPLSLAGGMYDYVDSNPLRLADPSGLQYIDQEALYWDFMTDGLSGFPYAIGCWQDYSACALRCIPESYIPFWGIWRGVPWGDIGDAVGDVVDVIPPKGGFPPNWWHNWEWLRQCKVCTKWNNLGATTTKLGNIAGKRPRLGTIIKGGKKALGWIGYAWSTWDFYRCMDECLKE